MKTVLITGASSGIGKAMSYKFTAEDFNLIMVARRIKALKYIKKKNEKNKKKLTQSFNLFRIQK